MTQQEKQTKIRKKKRSTFQDPHSTNPKTTTTIIAYLEPNNSPNNERIKKEQKWSDERYLKKEMPRLSVERKRELELSPTTQEKEDPNTKPKTEESGDNGNGRAEGVEESSDGEVVSEIEDKKKH
ncbi:hypothetical protein PIB30_045469 [Stylosanthes scabra]|uniref:Uncharacterized protein n=1 Tax=Stylosanthes scabra TaxID=79078 RepID=A0ABU6UIX1_9FABA|nr:hypothetical protein [Stylosanthes scabra]